MGGGAYGVPGYAAASPYGTQGAYGPPSAYGGAQPYGPRPPMFAPPMQPGAAGQRPPPPGTELPTPAPLPEEGATDPNQGAIVAAILGGSAILGIAIGCLLFRNKGGAEGDSDDDADSDDDESDESD